jgi:hypothetical protein
MIRVKRILTGSNFSYDDVEVIRSVDQQRVMNIGSFVNHPVLDQMVIKTRDGKVRIISDWNSGLLEVKSMNPPLDSKKVAQLVVCGDVSFGPAFIIKQCDSSRYNIPEVFRHQLSFVSDGSLFICREQNLTEITL